MLDFLNDVEGIRAAFQDYYQATILSQATDPNKLNDLKSGLDEFAVYTQQQVEQISDLFLAGADRPLLDPILDKCRENYKSELDEDGQVKFKGDAKAFVRTYDFLCTVLGGRDPDGDGAAGLLLRAWGRSSATIPSSIRPSPLCVVPPEL